MPAYQITYTRDDMPNPCKALKFANDEKTALELLCAGNRKKGLRLRRSGVSIQLKEVKEL